MKGDHAFSLVEALILVVVIGILATLGTATVSNLNSSARTQKLQSDVDTLNRSVRSYLASGGDLSAATTPEEVLNALKKRLESSSRVPGHSGSKIDDRLSFSLQRSDETSRKGLRAYWDSGTNRFVIRDSGNTPGIKGFHLDDKLALQDFGTEEAKGPFLYAERDSWIWDYAEAAPSAVMGPTTMPVSEIPDSTPGGSGTGAPLPAISPLSPPTYSIPSGAFPIHDFNLLLTLGNPNPSGTSSLYYSLDFGDWKLYTGPLSIAPSAIVAAQAIAMNDLYSNSSRAEERYDFIPVDLNAPIISPSHPEMGLFYDRIVMVTLVDQNSSSISRMQYKIGGDPWQDYHGAFPVSRDDYPSGVLIQAKALPLDSYFLASSVTLRTIGAEIAFITGTASGSFSDPQGGTGMVTNLSGSQSSDYFAWGRDYWTAAELASMSNPPALSESWLNYDGISFHDIAVGSEFEIGKLSYFNGTNVSGTGADAISFAVDLNLMIGGMSANTSFHFDFELINVLNKNDPNDPWADADFVKLSQPVASQTVTIGGVQFNLLLEFGETTSGGIAYFNEFHVLEWKSATTQLYGTLVEVGSINFNN